MAMDHVAPGLPYQSGDSPVRALRPDGRKTRHDPRDRCNRPVVFVVAINGVPRAFQGLTLPLEEVIFAAQFSIRIVNH